MGHIMHQLPRYVVKSQPWNSPEQAKQGTYWLQALYCVLSLVHCYIRTLKKTSTW